MKKIIALFLALLLSLSVCACGSKEPEVVGQNYTIRLNNRTGYNMTALRVCGQDTEDWTDNCLSAPLADQETLQLDLGFFADDVAANGFTMEIETDGPDANGSVEKIKLKSGDTVMFYVEDNQLECALNKSYEDLHPTADPAAFCGVWEYDEFDTYIVIAEDGTWASCDSLANLTAEGDWELDGSVLTLLLDGDSILSLYCEDSALKDSDGDMLHPAELPEGKVLPSADDPLTAKITFTGAPITVSYPATMSGKQRADLNNQTLSFNAVNEEGTDDWYTNVTMMLCPISGYEPYMKRGYDTAKAYMEHMATGLANSMYPDKIRSFSINSFEDCGTYWKCIAFAWMENSVFSDYDGDEPILGVFDVRYIGDTGYAMVTSPMAISSRIDTYTALAEKIADSAVFDFGFTTAVKTVPSKPAQYTSGDSGDSGDYGDTYYWYDSDGDVWYWNGYEDIFIGFGDDYYIDDDGQYYESNDAGWDYEDWDDWDDYGYYEANDAGWDAWDDYDYDWDYEDWSYYDDWDY